jgi:DNA processing protein
MASQAPALAYEIDYDDDRMVRLLLGRLIEPEDQLFAELRGHAPPRALLRAIAEDDARTAPWPEALARRLAARLTGLRLRLAGADPDADLATGVEADARFLIPGDPQWPRALDDLGERAPFGLWMIGSFPPELPAVSLVGARACTGYGNQAAGQLAAELARQEAVVVSGAAIGVDGAAHRGALAVGGCTVAVLACGIDRSYPATHAALIQAIGQRGAVLAELPPGTSPARFRFLARNRLIAALGLGTVVVEAAVRSGSLVTAHQAADLGRAVFAVPGPVTSSQSTGTNLLLSDGAVPALDAAQILAELGVPPRRRKSARAPHHTESHTEAQGTAAASHAEAPSSAPPQSRDAEPPLTPEPGREPTAPTSSGPGPAASPSPQHSLREVATDPVTVLVCEALPRLRSGRAAEVLELAVATGLEPARVLASLGLLAARGRAVKTGKGWALR